ncbi:hypothetical protein [Polaromonas sp.]|uniref:hypothetical protein n=1 Tax=Polaromonas sp. TaxID=1869339 RepID=UPI003264C172
MIISKDTSPASAIPAVQAKTLSSPGNHVNWLAGAERDSEVEEFDGMRLSVSSHQHYKNRLFRKIFPLAGDFMFCNYWLITELALIQPEHQKRRLLTTVIVSQNRKILCCTRILLIAFK